MDIAAHQGKGPVTLNDIAERQGISVKYLWQVINPLKTAGLLNVTRGAKGGYVLARRPESITMLEIMTTLEGPISLVDCIAEPGTCNHIDTCIARTVWMDVNRVVEKELKSITLDDILHRCGESAEADNYVI